MRGQGHGGRLLSRLQAAKWRPAGGEGGGSEDSWGGKEKVHRRPLTWAYELHAELTSMHRQVFCTDALSEPFGHLPQVTGLFLRAKIM